VTCRKRQWHDRKWRHVTSGDRKWLGSCHLTGSDLDVAVEGRKLAYTVRLTSYKAVARRRKQSRDRKWRHEPSGDRKWRHLTGSHLEVDVEDQKLAYTVHLTSYKAVVSRRRQSRDRYDSRDLRWPEVIQKWRHLSRSHLEVVVGRKLAYTVCLTTYKAVARRRRQSRDTNWRHVTSGDRK